MKLEKLVLIKEILKDELEALTCNQCSKWKHCEKELCDYYPSEDFIESLARKIADEVL